MARLSNYELLRIIALIMVVSMHVVGQPMYGIPLGDPKWHIASLIGHISRPCVDIFVLIGSFFMVDIKLFDIRMWKRMWRIIYPVIIFISIMLYYVIIILNINVNMFDFFATLINSKFKNLGPVTYGHLWYIYPYILLIILSPMLNAMVNALDRKQLRYALLTMLLLFIVFPSINQYSNQVIIFQFSNNLFLFITLFFFAAYIRKYDLKWKLSKGTSLFILFGIMGSILTWYATAQLFPTDQYWHGFEQSFYRDSGLLVFSASIFIFLGFRSISLNNNIINILGKATYEAYLIQFLVIYMIKNYIDYNQYFFRDSITFTMVTFGIIISATVISMFYGITRLYIDDFIKKLYKKYHIKNNVV